MSEHANTGLTSYCGISLIIRLMTGLPSAKTEFRRHADKWEALSAALNIKLIKQLMPFSEFAP